MRCLPMIATGGKWRLLPGCLILRSELGRTRAGIRYDVTAAVEPSTAKQELPALAIQDRLRQVKYELT